MKRLDRKCGDCQLCCKLMPMKKGGDANLKETVAAAMQLGLMTASEVIHTVPDFDKPAGCRCPHQRNGKGCMIYARRPFGCRLWNCRWLNGDDTHELQRPDRAHYVIDIGPDFIRTDDPNLATVPVVQVWCDPDYPDAHRDPALRAFLARRGEQERFAALIRYSDRLAFLLVPPSMSATGDWQEVRSECVEKTHTAAEKTAVLGQVTIMIEARHDIG